MGPARCRDHFLLLLGCTYLVAFSSVLLQAPGLYGVNGLEPVDKIVGRIANQPAGARGGTCCCFLFERVLLTDDARRAYAFSDLLAPAPGCDSAGAVA
jgi:hypothetical protein